MHVLITRPREDAEALSDRLHAVGHTTFIEPLIEVVFDDRAALDIRGAQALVFTSANAARAAARATKERDIRVFAVGPATAAEARRAGFANVSESSGEGVEGLAAHVRATATPGAGVLLHPSGSVTAGDLQATLAPFGFTVRREVIYEARAATSFSGALTAELSAGMIDAALFFSPRTASLFATLIAAADLAPACTTVAAFVLSEAVTKPLLPLAFRQVRVAPHPTAEALLELIGRA